MRSKKTFIIFKSSQEATNFLKDKWNDFKDLTTIESRKLFLLELQASPEFRVANTILNSEYQRNTFKKELPLSTILHPLKGSVIFPEDFNGGISPNNITRLSFLGVGPHRDISTDLIHMRAFYNMNHMPGNP